jgi:sialate O-acetylesterase
VVSVFYGGVEGVAVVDPDGGWKVELPALEPSGEGKTLRVASAAESLEVVDVLVGQVWLCAGQSNMDYALARATGGRDEARGAEAHPGIRLLDLRGVHTGRRPYGPEERRRLHPGKFFEGGWQRAGESSAAAFSAVGWWAGKELHQRTGVPVGLIDVSVGGSGTEAWLPREILDARKDYAGLRGAGWMEAEEMSAWARGRAKRNLGGRGGPHPFQPGFLFEAGVRRWRGFPLSGVFWYQGETNAERHDDAWNERLITDLVSGWRQVLGQADLPFYMVQLPRIGGDDPLRKWWPEYRQVQSRAARSLERVALIVTEDLGWDSPDVHPPDKRPIGERLGKRVLESSWSQ